jgi:hypothetical protein
MLKEQMFLTNESIDPAALAKLHNEDLRGYLSTQTARMLQGIYTDPKKAVQVYTGNPDKMSLRVTGLGKFNYHKTGVTPEQVSADARILDAILTQANKTAMMSTVNVLTLSGGVPQSLKSWPETPEGNKAAERYFKEVISNSGCPEEDLEAAVEDGIYEAEPTGFDFFITHSD